MSGSPLHIILASIGVLVFVGLYLFSRNLNNRDQFIKKYRFPELGFPLEVIEGFRTFLLIYVRSNQKAALPSKAVQQYWEALSQDKAYKLICMRSITHVIPPLEVYRADDIEALKITWDQSCQIEDISRVTPKRLPSLFSLDTELHQEDGLLFTFEKEPDKIDILSLLKSVGERG